MARVCEKVNVLEVITPDPSTVPDDKSLASIPSNLHHNVVASETLVVITVVVNESPSLNLDAVVDNEYVGVALNEVSVSYTHLTLPTILLV